MWKVGGRRSLKINEEMLSRNCGVGSFPQKNMFIHSYEGGYPQVELLAILSAPLGLKKSVSDYGDQKQKNSIRRFSY